MRDRRLAVLAWQKLSLQVRLGLLAGLSSCVANGMLLLPVGAQEAANPQKQAIDPSFVADDLSAAQPHEQNTPIPQLSDLAPPATTVDEWMAQLAQVPIAQVTGVRVEIAERGLQVVLETEGAAIEVPATSALGNALIVEIPNVAIAEEFFQAEPIAGIALVEVTLLPGDRVRVAITGTDAPPVAEVQLDGQNLVLVVALGEADAAAEEEAIEVVVTGNQDEGYNPSNATTATRTDTPLRDIPASIQVIPQQVIEDQGVTGLQDAVRNNAPGVTTSQNYAGTGQGEFIIRGFRQNYNFRNGFRYGQFGYVTDLSEVERIEVLRGPASVLSGQLQPGGVVNLVTEQPLREPTYTIEFTGGQFSFYRPEIDFSAPLNEDGSLRYRLNAAYQNAGSFRDFVDSERVFIAPVLQWDISNSTTLTVDAAYQYFDPVFDRGLVSLDDGSLVLPISRFLGYPSLDDYYEVQLRLGYRLEHRFSEDWQIRNAFYFSSLWQDGAYSDYSFSDLINNRFQPRNYSSAEYLNEEYGLQTDVVGNFATGSIQHQLLIGLDLNRSTGSYNYGAGDLPPIDIFEPDYSVSRVPTPVSYFETTFTDNLGVFVQDQIALLDNLRLLLGGRLDSIDQYGNQLGTDYSQSSTAFSPRVGVVYQPIEPISLYASFSRSFFPVLGRSRDNEVFEPERGTQYEIGIKADISDRLSMTLAAFDLTRSNVLTTDPDDPNFSIQVGEQRSQGVEFTVTGEILPGWNVLAGYAYTDARVTEDNRLPVGDALRNVAENTANLWTTYEIQSGDLQGLGFGFGLVFVDERQGTLPNSNFQLPSYTRADASLFYRRDNWQAAVNVQNLFDAEYYESSFNRNTVSPGAPFNVTASVSYTF